MEQQPIIIVPLSADNSEDFFENDGADLNLFVAKRKRDASPIGNSTITALSKKKKTPMLSSSSKDAASSSNATTSSSSPFNSPTLGRLKGMFTKKFGLQKPPKAEKLQEDGALAEADFEEDDDDNGDLKSSAVREREQPGISSFKASAIRRTRSWSQVDYFTMLPDEILVHMLTFLSARDVVYAVALLDPRFSRLSEDESLWKLKFSEKFQHAPSPKMGARGWRHAYRLQSKADKDWLDPHVKPTVQRFSSHHAVVRAVDFDDTEIVSGGEDKCIVVWDRTKRLPKKLLTGEHKGFIHSLILTDNILVSGANDNLIKLFNRKEDYKSAATINAHEKGVRCLELNGTSLFSGSYDHTIKLWDLETQKQISELIRQSGDEKQRAHEKTVFDMQYRPQESLLISTGADRHVRAFDTRIQKQVYEIDAVSLHSDWMMTVCVDDKYTYTGSRDKTISVWDNRTHALSHVLKGHNLGVVDLQLDGQKLYSGSGDNTARVWDLDKRVCVRAIEHDDTVWCLRFKEDTLVSGAGKSDGQVRLFAF